MPQRGDARDWRENCDESVSTDWAPVWSEKRRLSAAYLEQKCLDASMNLVWANAMKN